MSESIADDSLIKRKKKSARVALPSSHNASNNKNTNTNPNPNIKTKAISKSKSKTRTKTKTKRKAKERRKFDFAKNNADRSGKQELQQRQQQQQLYQFHLSPRYFQYLRKNCASLPLLISTHATDCAATELDATPVDKSVENGNTHCHVGDGDSDGNGNGNSNNNNVKNTNKISHNEADTDTGSNAANHEQRDSNAAFNSCVRDSCQIERSLTLAAYTPASTATVTTTTTTTTSTVAAPFESMPLSQGHYAKGAFAATKRAALKASRINDEPKNRKYSSENSNNFHNNNNNNNNNSNTMCNNRKGNVTNNRGSYLAATKGLLASGIVSSIAAPNSHLRLQQQTFSNSLSEKSQYSNNNNNDDNVIRNQNAQVLYYVGESLAHCGRLQEAFDIYAHIASKQLDGSVALDRLNVLATCLISYVRQLNKKLQADSTNPGTIRPTTPDTLGLSKCGGVRRKSDILDAVPRNKYAKCEPAVNAYAAAVPNIAEAIDVDVGGFDLFENVCEPRLSCDVGLTATGSDDFDPLLCPLCNDILRCPVTANCGHTFCRQCCEVITMCNICHVKFPRLGYDEFATMISATPTIPSAAASVTETTASTAIATTPFVASYGDNARENLQALRLLRNMPQNAGTTSLLGHISTGIDSQAGDIGGSIVSNSYPRTVTTSTVSLTTATATTTIAATPTALGGNASGGPHTLKFMTDVTVRCLVEKWWGPDLQAQKISETAASYMHLNLLDDALKFCNASLEKSPTNFKSLLLRAEVLRKLNHFQSSLSDVDNALRSRYSSAKAHYLRALVLSELGRIDEALFANCLAISLDKTTNLSGSEIFQHDLAKVLQKLLAQTPKFKAATYAIVSPQRSYINTLPYSILAEHRLRRKQNTLMSSANGDNLSVLDHCECVTCSDVGDGIGKSCVIGEADIIAADDEFLIGAASVAAYPDFEHGDCELHPLRRPSSRKHFRRKWAPKETELMPTVMLSDARCSALFRGVLERTQQELQRLKKLEASGESQRKQSLQVSPNLIDASDFDCILCYRTFWKPVVTPCGHTYCWVCLDRCMDYTSLCPLCMSPLVEPNVNVYQGSSSPVPFVLAKRPVTKFLEAAMKRFIPDSYEKRFRQEMDLEPSVPVFICTTAFPYVPCPLFVYEPRYRLMVRRAVESGEKQFGIVQPQNGKSRYCDVGTLLDIRDCVLLGDGCSILSTIGCKRFRILARSEKDGYETAKIEYIYDEAIAEENIKLLSIMHAAVLTKAIEWFESLSVDLKQEIFQSFGEMPPVEDNWDSIADGPSWAWWIIALLPLSQQLKVDILATTSLEKRLRAIEKTLDYLSGTFQRTQQSCDAAVVQQQQQQQHDRVQQQCNEAANISHSTSSHDECCQRTNSVISAADHADDQQPTTTANTAATTITTTSTHITALRATNEPTAAPTGTTASAATNTEPQTQLLL